jgi:hypothetical protein
MMSGACEVMREVSTRVPGTCRLQLGAGPTALRIDLKRRNPPRPRDIPAMERWRKRAHARLEMCMFRRLLGLPKAEALTMDSGV